MRALVLAVVVLAGCSDASNIVAVEALVDADLRVIVGRTSRTSDIEVLLADAPYRYEQEALSEVFDRQDVLQVWVFGFRVADLNAAFPAIASTDPSVLVTRLSPALGAPASGVYEPPAPSAVLQATVDGETDVEYQPIRWDEARLIPEAAFGFSLPGEIVCPPVDSPLRVWLRGSPQRTCLFVRNSACEWTRAAEDCPNAAAIFGDLYTPDSVIRERPNGALLVSDSVCGPVAARNEAPSLGETRAWRCGARTIAAQERGQIGERVLAVGRKTRIESADITNAVGYAVGRPGLYFGVENDGAHIRRVAVEAGLEDFQSVEVPVVDRPVGDRPAASTDGRIVDLQTGTYGTIVGESDGQCFRTIESGRQLQAALVSRKLSGTSIELVGMGLGAALAATNSWQIVGDPGSDFVASPTSDGLRVPAAIGELERLTVRHRVDPIVVLAHGTNGTYRSEQVTRFPNDLNYFGCPQPVAHPADLVGDIVVGSGGTYALVSNGALVLDESGAELSRLRAPAGIVYTDSSRIHAVRAGTSPERIVVHDEAGNVDFFDSATGEHVRQRYGGAILGFVDGPKVLYRPDNQPFEVVLADINGDGTSYAVPSFDDEDAGPIVVDAAAVFDGTAGTFVGFATERGAGLLDLTTGLSVTIPTGPGARTRMVFTDDSAQEIWIAVQTNDTTLELVEIGQ